MSDLREIRLKLQFTDRSYPTSVTLCCEYTDENSNAMRMAEEFLDSINYEYKDCSNSHQFRLKVSFFDNDEYTDFVKMWNQAVVASERLSEKDFLRSEVVCGNCGSYLEMDMEISETGRLVATAESRSTGEIWQCSEDLVTIVNNLSPHTANYLLHLLKQREKAIEDICKPKCHSEPDR